MLNYYIKNNPHPESTRHTKEVVCMDGFTMSVHTSSFNYCTLRKDNAGEYATVEVGFPSGKPTFFAEFAEDEQDYTGTVYGYVPVELVEKEIMHHGGLK